MIVYILIGIIVLCLLYVLVTYNSFIKLRNKINEAFSTMDVFLKKRWDLIPNLVEVVKGYAKHEKTTLEEVIKYRNTNYDSLSNKEKMNASEEITKGIGRLMAIVEEYPKLKASDNFIHLSDELTQVENEIANSRRYYNAVVRMFNNKVEMFPSNIIGKMLGLKTESMFEASAEERENQKVDI